MATTTTASTETDRQELRRALGQFATGVTIVTASQDDGAPVGVTANSFNSVSLDPPLVLWSLCRSAYSLSAFEHASCFCVHVLTSEQTELAERFARAGADKFSGIEWSAGIGNAPLLPDYVARFQCRRTDYHRVGDHVVFIGEVLAFAKTEKRPLVFYGGGYAETERRRKNKSSRRATDSVERTADRRKQ